MLSAGDRAPEFALEAVEGGRRTLSERLSVRSGALAERLAGGPVLLAFFALDCATCEICYLLWDRFHVRYGEAGCELWGIGLDGRDDLERFVERSGVEFPVLVDAGLATVRAFGAVSTPALFLVRGDGTIEASHEGFERAALNELCRIAAEWTGVEAMQVGPGEAPELRPGCTIHGL
jgi:peroxiredoxin